MQYWELPELSDIYLEDSFVLNICESDVEIVFDLDVVLTDKHPSYHPPHAHEQYCYKHALLTFAQIKSKEWITRRAVQYIDANRETDMGNIDSLIKNGEQYLLEGDWGKLAIMCDKLEFVIKQ